MSVVLLDPAPMQDGDAIQIPGGSGNLTHHFLGAQHPAVRLDLSIVPYSPEQTSVRNAQP